MAQTVAHPCKDRPERLAWFLKTGKRVLFEDQQNLVFLVQRFKTDASFLSDIFAKVSLFEQDIQSTATLLLIEYEHQRQLKKRDRFEH